MIIWSRGERPAILDRGGALQAHGPPPGKAEARAREALERATSYAPDSINAQDVKGYFAHCGYGTALAQAQCPCPPL